MNNRAPCHGYTIDVKLDVSESAIDPHGLVEPDYLKLLVSRYLETFERRLRRRFDGATVTVAGCAHASRALCLDDLGHDLGLGNELVYEAEVFWADVVDLHRYSQRLDEMEREERGQ